jgi:hypothetical protein
MRYKGAPFFDDRQYLATKKAPAKMQVLDF